MRTDVADTTTSSRTFGNWAKSLKSKERYRATQGLLVVLKDHTAPLLGRVPECLRIEETFDETLKNYMENLLGRLQSFELEFQGQRDKIPDALRRSVISNQVWTA